jgi:hypothetical protein
MLARPDKPLRLVRKPHSRSAAGGGCLLQSLVKMSHDAARSRDAARLPDATRSGRAGEAASVETIGIA